MTFALVSALPEELQAVLDLLPDEQRIDVGGRGFWRGHLHGQTVVAVLSGIGKVAAATTTALLIERFGASAIVMTGVAGGIGAGVKVENVHPGGQLREEFRVLSDHAAGAHVDKIDEILRLNIISIRENSAAHDVEHHVGKMMPCAKRVVRNLQAIRAGDDLFEI